MTLDKTNGLIATPVQLGNGCNRNTVRMVFGEVMRDHGLAAVDQLILGHGLEHKRASSPVHTLNARLSSRFIQLI